MDAAGTVSFATKGSRDLKPSMAAMPTSRVYLGDLLGDAKLS